MAPSKGRKTQGLSAEKKLAKKLQDKLRYEKKKSDPVKSVEMKLISQENYRKRKEKGMVESVMDMTEREKRRKRKFWREATRAYRQKKKEAAAIAAMIEEPLEQVDDVENAYQCDRPSTSSTPNNVPHQLLSARKRITKKVIKI